MTFAAPVLLAGLALLVPLLIAFLMRFRRDVVKVPSILLYRLAGARVVRQRRFKNLRRWLAVLLCLAGVAALVLAAAKPSAKSRGETVAIVIDTSASMSAGGGRSSPLARAKAFAARRIASGGPRDRYAIIAAGSAARRVAGPAAPGPDLDEALERLEAEKGAADLGSAIELAAALVSGARDPHVLVLGDGGASMTPPSGIDAPITERVFKPEVRDDLGIFAMTSRPVEGTEAERDIALEIATSSDKPRRAKIEVKAEGRRVLTRVIEVPAHGEAEVHARVVASAAEITAEVSPADGVADAIRSDDRAEIHASSARQAVLLVGADGVEPEARFFVEKAIAAAGGFRIVPAPPSLEGVKMEDIGVAVVLGAPPAKKLGVPALYVGTIGGSLPYSGFHSLEGTAAHLRSIENKDPLLRGVSLDGVTIESATAIDVPKGARALVDLDGGSVLVAGGALRTRWMYLGIDPAKSDLALRVAFPVLVANALHALGGTNDLIAAETVARSEMTLADVAASDLADEPAPRWRLGVAPAALLAIIGSLLLALEALAWRKGWANA